MPEPGEEHGWPTTGRETWRSSRSVLHRQIIHSPDDLDDASSVVRDGYMLWLEMKGERTWPARRDLDPLLVPPRLLPHMLMIDIDDGEPRRFRWRLLGTHITTVMQRDSTGQYFDEIYTPDEYAEVTAGPKGVLRSQLPCYTVTRAPDTRRSFIRLESVDMPFSLKGDRMDMILAFAVAIHEDNRQRLPRPGP